MSYPSLLSSTRPGLPPSGAALTVDFDIDTGCGPGSALGGPMLHASAPSLSMWDGGWEESLASRGLGSVSAAPVRSTETTLSTWHSESLFPQPLWESPVSMADVSTADVSAADLEGPAPSELPSELLRIAPELGLSSLNSPSSNTLKAIASNSRKRQLLASYQASLSELDDYNPQRFATFKDDYLFNIGEGSLESNAETGAVEFNLSTSDFDPYLQILPIGNNKADGGQILAFDDDSGPGRDAQLRLTVRPGDRFIVRVTSYAPEAVGNYRLSLISDGSISVSPGGNNAGDGHSDDGNPKDPLTPLVDGNVQPDLEQFRKKSGYGLVNAAAAVAAALNLAQPERDQPFAEVRELGQFDQPLDLLQVPEVWAQGFSGQGVTVAVVDSGLDSDHGELRNSLWVNEAEIPGDGIDNDQNGYVDDIHGWNFGRDQLNNQIAPGTDSPFQGHGTHVAGIIAGARDHRGNTGVAYDAKIMPLRLGDTNNAGVFLNPGDLAEAVRYAVDNGADVINLSLGWSDSPALRSALQYAAENNIIVVSASGNRGLSSPVSPARYAMDWGLSVGAVTHSGKLATFSNGAGYNANIRHVVAPGNRIVSADPGGGYQTRSGTSMAAPYVSGVVALMLSANPELTQTQVRDILAATAIAIT